VKSGQTGIASAIIKSSLGIAHPGEKTSSLSSATGKRSSGINGRSPYLTSGARNGEVDSRSEDEFGDEEDDDDESFSDDDDRLPVTGFAVASNRRNQEFHQLFSAVDEGDYLIDGELTVNITLLWLIPPRLWLCLVKRHFGAGAALYFRESHLLPRKHLWMGDGCELRIANTCGVLIGLSLLFPLLKSRVSRKK
jgi:hypothetical protein